LKQTHDYLVNSNPAIDTQINTIGTNNIFTSGINNPMGCVALKTIVSCISDVKAKFINIFGGYQ
jgi:hypothetical protein